MLVPLKNIVVFLNGNRGIDVLKSLIKNGKPIVAVVGPDKSEIWNLLQNDDLLKGCHFVRQRSVNDEKFLSVLQKFEPELFIVAGFSEIFGEKLLDLPKFGTLNLHGGPLPKYRGGSPLNWQMINDEPDITISIIQMDKGIDTGDVVGEKTFSYSDEETIVDIHRKANKHFSLLTLEVLEALENDNLQKREQDEQQASYWMQRKPHDGLINWYVMSSREVFNLVRALAPPYPNAFTVLDGRPIHISEVQEVDLDIIGTPGRVLFLRGKGPYVMCKDKCILIKNASEKISHGVFLGS